MDTILVGRNFGKLRDFLYGFREKSLTYFLERLVETVDLLLVELVFALLLKEVEILAVCRNMW